MFGVVLVSLLLTFSFVIIIWAIAAGIEKDNEQHLIESWQILMDKLLKKPMLGNVFYSIYHPYLNPLNTQSARNF